LRNVGYAITDRTCPPSLIDGKFSQLTKQRKQWFGHLENRIVLETPTAAHSEEFFMPLINDIRRLPNQFPDGVKRRK